MGRDPRHKLRGDLDERITKAYEALAEHRDVDEVFVPVKTERHISFRGIFRVMGMPYNHVRGAAVKVGVYSKQGYGKVVEVISSSMSGIRNFLHDRMPSLTRNPEPYFT